MKFHQSIMNRFIKRWRIVFGAWLTMALLAGCGPTLDDARKLGFTSVEEMETAQRAGYQTKAEYDERYREFGFASLSEMQSLQERGYAYKVDYALVKARTPEWFFDVCLQGNRIHYVYVCREKRISWAVQVLSIDDGQVRLLGVADNGLRLKTQVEVESKSLLTWLKDEKIRVGVIYEVDAVIGARNFKFPDIEKVTFAAPIDRKKIEEQKVEEEKTQGDSVANSTESSGEESAVVAAPACPKDTSVVWSNCFGERSFSVGEVGDYVGEFRNDQRHGQGTLSYPDGSRYVGGWKDDIRHGSGIWTHPDGRRFEGELRNNLPNGSGEFRYQNGDKYSGEFADDKKNGRGVYTFLNGEIYVGEFSDDKINGRGVYTFPSGEKYVGDFKNDKADGLVTWTHPNGEKYIGEVRDWQRTGQGTFTWPDGKAYVGEFRSGKPNGWGVHTWPDGEKYVGEFRDWLRNGRGIQYGPAGTVLTSGVWLNDRLSQAVELDKTSFPFDQP